MVISEEEMLADLRKVRVRSHICLAASAVLTVLAAALVVSYFVRLPRDIAALILAAAALVFAGVMANQTVRARRLGAMIAGRLAAAGDGEAPGGDPGGAPGRRDGGSGPGDSSAGGVPGAERGESP